MIFSFLFVFMIFLRVPAAGMAAAGCVVLCVVHDFNGCDVAMTDFYLPFINWVLWRCQFDFQVIVQDQNTLLIENVIFIMKNILEMKMDQPCEYLGATSIESLMLAIVRLAHCWIFLFPCLVLIVFDCPLASFYHRGKKEKKLWHFFQGQGCITCAH